MIAHLSGKLIGKSIESVTVDVGGVGYEVYVPLSTFYSLPDEGQNAALLIYTHVKEDAIKLYGFSQPGEKDMFTKLIAVSGVGPKLALNILSGIDPVNLHSAIRNGDIAVMNAIPGVGKKTAERLILELKDKVSAELEKGRDRMQLQSPERESFDDALSALLNLGYKKVDVENALSRIDDNESAGQCSVEFLIKSALKILAK